MPVLHSINTLKGELNIKGNLQKYSNLLLLLFFFAGSVYFSVSMTCRKQTVNCISDLEYETIKLLQ